MKFFATLVALVAAPLLVLAADNPNPFNTPTGGYNATAGQALALSWTPTTSGTVSLYLRSGASNALTEGVAIATNIANSGSYTYNIPSTVTRGSDYTIEIRATAGSNYTPFFVIESTNTVASVTNPSSATSATSTRTSSGTASGSTASGSTVSSGTASTTSGTATTSSGSSASSGSTTGGSSTTSKTTSSTFQSTTSAAGGAPRATAAAGMMGLIAMGALVL